MAARIKVLSRSLRRWPDGTHGPLTLRLTIAKVDDRPDVVGVELWAVDPGVLMREATEDSEQGAGRACVEWLSLLLQPLPGSSVHTTDLRRIALRDLLDRQLETLRQRAQVIADIPSWHESNIPEAYRQEVLRVGAELEVGDNRRGRRPSYDVNHYQRVARIYSEALANGLPPTRTVATREHVSKSAAAKWVARARTLGYLAPTTRGRPNVSRELSEGSQS